MKSITFKTEWNNRAERPKIICEIVSEDQLWDDPLPEGFNFMVDKKPDDWKSGLFRHWEEPEDCGHPDRAVTVRVVSLEPLPWEIDPDECGIDEYGHLMLEIGTEFPAGRRGDGRWMLFYADDGISIDATELKDAESNIRFDEQALEDALVENDWTAIKLESPAIDAEVYDDIYDPDDALDAAWRTCDHEYQDDEVNEDGDTVPRCIKCDFVYYGDLPEESDNLFEDCIVKAREALVDLMQGAVVNGIITETMYDYMLANWSNMNPSELKRDRECLLGRTIAEFHGVITTDLRWVSGKDSIFTKDESIAFKATGTDRNGEEVNVEFSIIWRDL